MERQKSTEPFSQKTGDVVYVIRGLNSDIDTSIRNELGWLPHDDHFQVSEAPPGTGFDFGINLIKISKDLDRNPLELAIELANRINSEKQSLIEAAETTGPFLNLKLDMQKFGGAVLGQIFDLKSAYGNESVGKGQKVVVDMSSPNIAKRMHIAHLRSTIIGDAIANLYRNQGYEVVRDNHLGDWGTGFGDLIVAIKKWGNEKKLLTSNDPIGGLQDLYVKFNAVAEQEKQTLWEEAKQKALKNGYDSIPGLPEAVENATQEVMERKQISRSEVDTIKVLEDGLDRVVQSSLEKEGRGWFLKLERGDPEARRLWKLCVDLSIKEFNQMYSMLGVGFEETLGESFYENQLQNVIDKVRKSKIGKVSEGALVVDMQHKGLGVAIVQKSDGASVYFTRDLACAIYRQEKMGADKVIYVVGGEQKQYFQQLFEALRMLGYKVGENAEHVYFGMVTLPEGKMSTRKGRVILLKDVIKEGLRRAEDILKQKNPELAKNKKLRDKVVRQVAIGALKWNDLSQDPKRPIEFNWDRALKLDGNSAPYVQYTAVRAKSIMEASDLSKNEISKKINLPVGSFNHPAEKALIRKLSDYPSALSEAIRESNPSKVAIYVYEVAKRFNAFYTNVPVLKSEDDGVRKSRLLLTSASIQVITNALGILGIEVPERM
jgi:arginyl-tRNA synthetase